MVHLDLGVQVENVDLQDKVEHLELKVHPDSRVHQGLPETEDNLDLQ